MPNEILAVAGLMICSFVFNMINRAAYGDRKFEYDRAWQLSYLALYPITLTLLIKGFVELGILKGAGLNIFSYTMPDGQHAFAVLTVLFCMLFAAFWNLLFSIALRTVLQLIFNSIGAPSLGGEIVEIDTSKPSKTRIENSSAKERTGSVIIHSRKQRNPRK